MINNISWASYCFAIGWILVAYYAIVITGYFRHDVSKLVSRFRSPAIIGPSQQSSHIQPTHLFSGFSKIGQSDSVGSETGSNAHFHIQTFLDELNAFFKQASRTGIDKPEIIASLKRLLLKHRIDPVTNDRAWINRVIQMHGINDCSIHLSDDDLATVWNE